MSGLYACFQVGLARASVISLIGKIRYFQARPAQDRKRGSGRYHSPMGEES